ncbi:FMN-dependent NADPH-azoreductase [Actinomadura rubteroloni]|uniref:FMN-dependent NADPH-azoreductase n=1 Tax=Actinomadura rubteroloni TaxID=1926885 RepID=A0A2P4UMD9_9ACTN|nr:NAD(P)H-dependent oxidoreductase [Actinomadura rubteroloni]POM26217.1 FMN-dependent NADPH-azoreductase [Actinomadura rubteroloni]
MTDRPLNLSIIVGSSREGRFGPTISRWFEAKARERGELAVDVVDTAETRLPAMLGAPATHPSAAEATAKLEASDAFVVITPEYNHSYPGTLKNLIDTHYQQWQAKPVGFVSYGGVSGGLRAVEHLRAVFAELHAVGIRDTVSFHNPWGRVDTTGALAEPEGAGAAASVLLDRLTWWGTALRDARTVRPYAG